jgi:hypothetical protein
MHGYVMKPMGDVVQLNIKPKSHTFTRKNASATIVYIPGKRVWQWVVTLQLKPQIFTGEEQTEAEAKAQVDKYLKT